MQITTNTTGMQTGLTLASDRDARDHCLVVIKGTFITNEAGELRLAEVQQPLVTADQHYGAPETSPVRLECDFALEKQRTDVLVIGKAVAPGGVCVEQLPVRLELPGRVKDILVVGDRHWVRTLGVLFPSKPVPFTEMPLTFDRSFGGSDDSQGPTKVESEMQNLAGVGFHPHRAARAVEGLPLPNLEHPAHPIRSRGDRPRPIGYGVVGRSWLPRRGYAGTYDQTWLDHYAPYLPPDFDALYNQSAPEDQQLPALRGGELIRCVHMSERPVVQYQIPTLRVPVRFRAITNDALREARLDTVILEPDLMRVQLVWRCSVPVGKKPSDLREIIVGERANEQITNVGTRDGKPMFRGLNDAVDSIRKRREAGTR